MRRDKLNHLIVGCDGEVGSALVKVLHKKTNVWGLDKEWYPPFPDKVDSMHVCIPWGEDFVSEFVFYKKQFKPKLIIVHSTVPVGTCDQLGVVHSPIRGVHPALVKGIKTFVKFFGGKKAKEAALMFKRYGLNVHWTKRASTTEALKLWDTAQYGVQVLINKHIYWWCRQHKVPFDIVYHLANRTYNEGYRKLGRFEVVRPYLKFMKGPIGGHCVVENAKLLDSVFATMILDAQNDLKKKK